jgi:hypothetical protein
MMYILTRKIVRGEHNLGNFFNMLISDSDMYRLSLHVSFKLSNFTTWGWYSHGWRRNRYSLEPYRWRPVLRLTLWSPWVSIKIWLSMPLSYVPHMQSLFVIYIHASYTLTFDSPSQSTY